MVPHESRTFLWKLRRGIRKVAKTFSSTTIIHSKCLQLEPFKRIIVKKRSNWIISFISTHRSKKVIAIKQTITISIKFTFKSKVNRTERRVRYREEVNLMTSPSFLNHARHIFEAKDLGQDLTCSHRFISIPPSLVHYLSNPAHIQRHCYD